MVAAPGSRGAHGTFVGRGHHDLGTATQRPVHRTGQPWIGRIVTRDDHHIQRADPLRNGGGADNGQSGAVAECGLQQCGRASRPAGAGDQYQTARPQSVQSCECALGDVGGGGTHLCTPGGGRTQYSPGIRGLHRGDVIEVEYGCPCDHRALPPPLNRVTTPGEVVVPGRIQAL